MGALEGASRAGGGRETIRHRLHLERHLELLLGRAAARRISGRRGDGHDAARRTSPRVCAVRPEIADACATPWTCRDDVHGYRLTWKRLANLYLNRYEAGALRPVLRSRPTRLVIEPTNVCNLRCPYCHTGAGRFGRRPA